MVISTAMHSSMGEPGEKSERGGEELARKAREEVRTEGFVENRKE